MTQNLTIEDVAYEAMIEIIKEQVRSDVLKSKRKISEAVTSYLTKEEISEIVKNYIQYDDSFRELMHQIMYDYVSKILINHFKGV